jgi:hypothetical protein
MLAMLAVCMILLIGSLSDLLGGAGFMFRPASWANGRFWARYVAVCVLFFVVLHTATTMGQSTIGAIALVLIGRALGMAGYLAHSRRRHALPEEVGSFDIGIALATFAVLGSAGLRWLEHEDFFAGGDALMDFIASRRNAALSAGRD